MSEKSDALLVVSRISHVRGFEFIIDDAWIRRLVEIQLRKKSVCEATRVLVGIWKWVKEHVQYKSMYENRVLVLLLHPEALCEIKNLDEKLYGNIKQRLLAFFIDEVHYGFTRRKDRGWKKWCTWREIAEDLVKESPATIGFTATPTRTLSDLFTRAGAYQVILFKKSSISLMAESADLPKERRILVPQLHAYFYRTYFMKVFMPRRYMGGSREVFLWGNAIRDRVTKYVEKVLEIARKEEVDLLKGVKALVLAPNTREAEIWRNILTEKLGDERVLVAHSKIRDEDPLEIIDEFKRRHSGVLVAVDMVKIGFDDPNLDFLVIARPINTSVGYVQMRGRVLRWPTRDDSFKAKREYAVLIHLAAERILEKPEIIRRAEGGLEDAKVYELSGYDRGDGEVSEIEAEVEVEEIKDLTSFLYISDDLSAVEVEETKEKEKIIPKVKKRDKWLHMICKLLKGILRKPSK